MPDLVLADKPSKETDWKPIAFVLLGFAFGMLAAYQLRVEDNAKAMAYAMCETEQKNVQIMIQNFNTMVKQCKVQYQGYDVPLLPMNLSNHTVRVYS